MYFLAFTDLQHYGTGARKRQSIFVQNKCVLFFFVRIGWLFQSMAMLPALVKSLHYLISNRNSRLTLNELCGFAGKSSISNSNIGLSASFSFLPY